MNAAEKTSSRDRHLTAVDERPARPMLLFFFLQKSGPCRRVDGYLAQVLQRRANHDTFAIHFVDAEQRADLVDQFEIELFPTLVVVDERRVRGRLIVPRGCREIEAFLAPWLR